jgi:hypothetical protein
MRLARFSFYCLMGALAVGVSAKAQTTSPDKPMSPPFYSVTHSPQPMPVFDYHSNAHMRVRLDGTWLAPKAHGEAKVFSLPKGLQVEVRAEGLRPAAELGPVFLTYVLWAVTSDKSFHNLGELTIKGSTGTLSATTGLDSFALMVTAEPYFAVTEPSGAIVLKNSVPQGALPYKFTPALLPLLRDRETPLDLIQARNAVRIARRLGAQEAAPQELEKAVELLSEAEQQYRNNDKWQTISKARKAVEAAETARLYTVHPESQRSNP